MNISANNSFSLTLFKQSILPTLTELQEKIVLVTSVVFVALGVIFYFDSFKRHSIKKNAIVPLLNQQSSSQFAMQAKDLYMPWRCSAF